MGYLYLLSEDDNDDAFYHRCVERLTGKSLELIPTRLRRGGGLSEVRSMARLFFKNIAYTGYVEDTYFVIAVDNDRSPVHPTHARLPHLRGQDARKQCRYCELDHLVTNILGEDRSAWPIPGAIAVPVEMLESWLLLIVNPSLSPLPIFAYRNQPSAKQYYGNQVPPQLKDLRNEARQQLGMGSNLEFCQHCAEHLAPTVLSQLSESFAQFKAQVDSWG